MVLYATIIPFNSNEIDSFNLWQETLKILINIVEVVLINYSLKSKNAFSDKEIGLKVLTVGLAWTFADSIFSYLLYFLMNATGEEFKWDYIQTAVQSNFDMIDKIAIVALVACMDKLTTDKKWNFHIMIIIIAKYFFSGLGFKYIDRLKFEDSWLQLLSRGVCTLAFGLFSRIIFSVVFRELTMSEEELAHQAYIAHKKKQL